MTTTIIISLTLFIFVSIAVFIWFYLFNIYEVKIVVSSIDLTLDENSNIEIKVIRLNSFGTKAICRKVGAEFKIVSGEEFIRIENTTINSILVYSKGIIGKSEILVNPSIGLFPSKIKIVVQ